MSTKLNTIERTDEDKVHFGASMLRQVVLEIDKARGDTNRSLWLQRLAIKELERQRKEEEEEKMKILKEKRLKNE